MSRIRPLLGAVVVASTISCASAGPWGHARVYAPLDGETAAVQGAREYDAVMADRSPEEWEKTPVYVFGVVLRGSEMPDGSMSVELSVRRLLERNVCESADEESCRVSVTDREFATLRAVLQPRQADLGGEEAVGAGSLLKLVGSLRRDDSGKQYLLATWHRHWPRGYFLTNSARAVYRR